MSGFARLMAEERRISLRVDEELFQQLDQKRFDDDTTFQDVGVRLLRMWLSGEANHGCVFETCTAGERKRLERYLLLLRKARHPEQFAKFVEMWLDEFSREAGTA